MGHRALIGGTSYETIGGQAMVDGTVYSIQQGRTMIGGTSYDIPFVRYVTVTIVRGNGGSIIANQCSVAIDGVSYTDAAVISVPVGTEILLTATGDTKGGNCGKITYHGDDVTVANVDDNGIVTYSFVADRPVEITMSIVSYSSLNGVRNYGMISVESSE